MSNYQTRFFTNLSKIYNNIENYHPDVTLFCIEDGIRLQCHRVILSTSCDYFKNVFSWTAEDVIEVHNGISGDILGIILKYIYSGEISITLENVSDVLSASNYFSLIEIVDDCIKFILDNLEINTSIDMFIFSWQLDLSKLINGIISFIAENFTYILNDDILKQKLYSLPVHLMVELLKSNDLVIRDEETELLTRPVKREKLILEFILSYSEMYYINATTSLLPCIKWPILKVFGEEEFAFSRLLPCLDKEKGREELERLLDVTYSDWFLSPQNCIPTEEDQSMYATRAFSCSELIPLYPMADGNEIMSSTAGSNRVNEAPKHFSIIAKDYEHLMKLDIVSRLWDGRTVVGGIGLYFCTVDKSVKHEHIGIAKENGTNVNTINLEKNEHITRVHGNAGHLIDCLVFETSKARTCGPYGGDGGGPKDFMDTIKNYREEGGYHELNTYEWHRSIVPGPHKRIYLDSILVGITGKEVRTGGEFAITHLKFVFREMIPSSRFLVSNENKCEISLPDANFRSTPESYTPESYHHDHHRSTYSTPDLSHNESSSYSDEYENEYHIRYSYSDDYDENLDGPYFD